MVSSRERAILAARLIQRLTAGFDAKSARGLSQIESRLAGSIRRLDGRMRFTKALQSAPLFCRRHATLVLKVAGSENFAEVQRAKLTHLRNALAKAALLNSEAGEPLIAAALAYFGRPVPADAPLEMEESSACREEAASELERWDEQRHFKRLATLESEAAALRYRNALLSEENHRFKLAHEAVQALREDLERDRAELIAKKNSADSNGIKASNRHRSKEPGCDENLHHLGPAREP